MSFYKAYRNNLNVSEAFSTEWDDATHAYQLLLDILDNTGFSFKRNPEGLELFIPSKSDLSDKVYKNLLKDGIYKKWMEDNYKTELRNLEKQHEKAAGSIRMVLQSKEEEIKGLRETVKLLTEANKTVKKTWRFW